ncbi:MAG: hypothetical protein WCC12_19795 [Anaerolineales bacterium]
MKRYRSTQNDNQDQEIREILKRLESLQAEYPADLLAARRAAFLAQLEQHDWIMSEAPLSTRDQDMLRLLKNLKRIESEYPARLLAARRSAFIRQIARREQISILEALRSSIRGALLSMANMSAGSAPNTMRTSLVVVAFILLAFAGSLLYVNRAVETLSPAPSRTEVSQPVPVHATSTHAFAQVVCKPGYVPPLCLAKEFNKSWDLTDPGNGLARPAVAKDTLPGYSGVHKSAYVNDGLYGSGASWISNSPNSWIKIDLGKSTAINTVAFGRDRLGNFNDRDPGRFVIAVALSDNIYADGNSSNDYVEYTEVFDSEQAGFDGVVAGAQTIKAYFESVVVRYIKITFANAGTAVDEVEVFMVQPPAFGLQPAPKPDDDSQVLILTVAPTSTPLPTETPIPTATNTPVPTNSPVPTNTPVPTSTPLPTSTPVPTGTPLPSPTASQTPRPTDTPLPPPEDLVVPFMAPTDPPLIVDQP